MDEVQLMALDGAINILQDSEGEVPESTVQWIVEKLREFRESLQEPRTVYVVRAEDTTLEVSYSHAVFLSEEGANAELERMEPFDESGGDDYSGTYYTMDVVGLFP